MYRFLSGGGAGVLSDELAHAVVWAGVDELLDESRGLFIRSVGCQFYPWL